LTEKEGIGYENGGIFGSEIVDEKFWSGKSTISDALIVVVGVTYAKNNSPLTPVLIISPVSPSNISCTSISALTRGIAKL
jgi:hypothetical protein